MQFRNGYYDDAQIKVLDGALNLACKELGVGEGAHETRERIAQLVLMFAKTGQWDAEQLKAYVVEQFAKFM
jgi:hypothetical protein